MAQAKSCVKETKMKNVLILLPMNQQVSEQIWKNPLDINEDTQD